MRTGAQTSKVRGKCLVYPRCSNVLVSVSYLLNGTPELYHNPHNGRKCQLGRGKILHQEGIHKRVKEGGKLTQGGHF